MKTRSRVVACWCAAIALLAAPLLHAQTLATAQVQDTLASYVRFLYGLGPSIQVRIVETGPSLVRGYSQVVVSTSYPSGFQENLVFQVSADRKVVIPGEAFEFGGNPFSRTLQQLTRDQKSCFGPPNAAVVLDSFGDFQCSYCKQEVTALLDEIMPKYPSAVRVCLHDAPLAAFHDWSRPAALAGWCIRRQSASAFQSYAKWIYNRQEKITKDNFEAELAGFASQARIDGDALHACTVGEAARAELAKSEEQADKLRISTRPALFVNGRRLTDLSPPALLAMIDYELGIDGSPAKDCGCSIPGALPHPEKKERQ